jgi:ribosomal protein L11
VQAGSGDPSPTNVRPITGWTGAKVMRCGKNFLENTADSKVSAGITFRIDSDKTVTVSGTAT